jgi:hypothetical protein
MSSSVFLVVVGDREEEVGKREGKLGRGRRG